MNRGMLAVWEDVSELRKLMQQEPDSHLRTRLHMLYLLRTGVARTRAQAAQLLGVGRNTVGKWLRQYERGGLTNLLQIKQAPGKISSLPPAVVAGMRAKLSDPRGCASFHELHHWVEKTYQVQTSYGVIWYTATHVLGARLAVARRTHIKKSPTPRRVFAPRSPNVCDKRP